ncbi:MAG: hypothetical protein KDJ36_16855, partial [Hyphomicrobiaceae bacterium]|nr:hypothetical protein [Hyphomicrobiaceae bacterium]
LEKINRKRLDTRSLATFFENRLCTFPGIKEHNPEFVHAFIEALPKNFPIAWLEHREFPRLIQQVIDLEPELPGFTKPRKANQLQQTLLPIFNAMLIGYRKGAGPSEWMSLLKNLLKYLPRYWQIKPNELPLVLKTVTEALLIPDYLKPQNPAASLSRPDQDILIESLANCLALTWDFEADSDSDHKLHGLSARERYFNQLHSLLTSLRNRGWQSPAAARFLSRLGKHLFNSKTLPHHATLLQTLEAIVQSIPPTHRCPITHLNEKHLFDLFDSLFFDALELSSSTSATPSPGSSTRPPAVRAPSQRASQFPYVTALFEAYDTLLQRGLAPSDTITLLHELISGSSKDPTTGYEAIRLFAQAIPEAFHFSMLHFPNFEPIQRSFYWNLISPHQLHRFLTEILPRETWRSLKTQEEKDAFQSRVRNLFTACITLHKLHYRPSEILSFLWELAEYLTRNGSTPQDLGVVQIVQVIPPNTCFDTIAPSQNHTEPLAKALVETAIKHMQSQDFAKHWQHPTLDASIQNPLATLLASNTLFALEQPFRKAVSLFLDQHQIDSPEQRTHLNQFIHLILSFALRRSPFREAFAKNADPLSLLHYFRGLLSQEAWDEAKSGTYRTETLNHLINSLERIARLEVLGFDLGTAAYCLTCLQQLFPNTPLGNMSAAAVSQSTTSIFRIVDFLIALCTPVLKIHPTLFSAPQKGHAWALAGLLRSVLSDSTWQQIQEDNTNPSSKSIAAATRILQKALRWA